MTTLNANALATRKNCKDYLKIAATGEDIDNLLHQLINRVSTQFESYCGRRFAEMTYTEYHPGGLSSIYPYHTPVTSVTNIWQDTDWVWDTNSLVPSADYVIVDDAYVIYDGMLDDGKNSVKITYTGGYSTIPEDIKQACIMEVGRLFRRRSDFDRSLDSADDGSTTYLTDELLPRNKATLDRYITSAVM